MDIYLLFAFKYPSINLSTSEVSKLRVVVDVIIKLLSYFKASSLCMLCMYAQISFTVLRVTLKVLFKANVIFIYLKSHNFILPKTIDTFIN